MGRETKIEWTNTYLHRLVMWKKKLTSVVPGATFNPWWGCVKVSPACKNCYAELLDSRQLHGKETHWGPHSNRMMQTDKYWNEPIRWNRECEKLGITRKVFCASMADVFEDHPQVEISRLRLWNLIEATPNLKWLLLTKRPENIMTMIPVRWREQLPDNVWIGTTVENQKTAEERIEHLIHVPAVVKFLSMEPLLGPVNLPVDANDGSGFVDWIITGGESGHGSRRTNPDWFRHLRDQCKKMRTPFFFKQWGHFDESGKPVGKGASGRILDGMEYNEMPEAA
jgi:protein gp37